MHYINHTHSLSI